MHYANFNRRIHLSSNNITAICTTVKRSPTNERRVNKIHSAHVSIFKKLQKSYQKQLNVANFSWRTLNFEITLKKLLNTTKPLSKISPISVIYLQTT